MENPIIARQEFEDDNAARFWEWVEDNREGLELNYKAYRKEQKAKGEKIRSFEDWVDHEY